jgi:hypothetical protein
MSKPNYLMEVFNSFLGYGKIDSKIIYFGIEEHGNGDDHTETSEKRMADYINKYELTKNKQSYFTMEEADFKLLYDNGANEGQIILDRENSLKSVLYRYCAEIDKVLKVENSLICNLYPLWKNTTNERTYSEEIHSKFGVRSFDEWYQLYFDQKRKPVLFEYFHYLVSTKDKYKIFTFGESEVFIKLFNDYFEEELILLSSPKKFNSKGRSDIYWHCEYKNLAIYILYHPSYKWLNENQRDELAKSL